MTKTAFACLVGIRTTGLALRSLLPYPENRSLEALSSARLKLVTDRKIIQFELIWSHDE
jgi:hypothetical protein